MAINIGYFGLSLNTSNLSGNPFMNCFLSAITEVPAYIVSTCLLRKCPRRAILSTFLIIGGGVLLLIQFIPDSKTSFFLITFKCKEHISKRFSPVVNFYIFGNVKKKRITSFLFLSSICVLIKQFYIYLTAVLFV